MRADFPEPPQQQRPHALEDLLRAWGLHRTPFSPDEKSAQLFAAGCHREALELLHTTAALRGLMLLTGPPGTGKRTLLKSWISSLEPKRFLPLLITHSNLSATGVLEILLSKLGERPRFKRSSNLLLLEKHLAELEPVTLVLILDDAQNYPAPALEEIRLFLGAGGRRRSAIAMILLGDDTSSAACASPSSAPSSPASAPPQGSSNSPAKTSRLPPLAHLPRRTRARNLRPGRHRPARRSQRRQSPHPRPARPSRMDRRRPQRLAHHPARAHPQSPAPSPRCERENPQSLTTKRAAPKALTDLRPSPPLCCRSPLSI